MKTKLSSVLVIMMIMFTCYSCKKEKSPTPSPVVVAPVTTHYHINGPKDAAEADDIYVTNDGGTLTMSHPQTSAYLDTLTAPTFTAHHEKYAPYVISGNISITADTLTLNYTEWTTPSITLMSQATNTKYIKM